MEGKEPVEVVSLSGMLKFFKDDQNSIEKGEQKFKSGFVVQVKIKEYTINAMVRASMKDKCYAMSLQVKGDGNITSASCECPKGNWICSHMAATAIYVNKTGFSKTDLPNSWLAKPKTAAKKDGKTMAEFFPCKRPDYKATQKVVSEQDRLFLFEKLYKASVHCPMEWIVKSEPEPPADKDKNVLEPVLIGDILEDFIQSKDIFVKKCKVSAEQIIWLAEQTKQQRNCQMWGKFRHLRLTGSNFGDVLGAIARHTTLNKPYPQSLFKKLKGEYSIGTKDSIMWGQMHEELATNQYMETTGNIVENAGLFLFPCGYLGSTPDGIVTSPSHCGKGVLEVKCPWKYRNATIHEMIQMELKDKDSVKGFYLTKSLSLNSKHNYWHQVQAEMAATNTMWAHFVIWTNKELKFIHVEKDSKWMEQNIPKLEEFYMNELMPHFFSKEE